MRRDLQRILDAVSIDWASTRDIIERATKQGLIPSFLSHPVRYVSGRLNMLKRLGAVESKRVVQNDCWFVTYWKRRDG